MWKRGQYILFAYSLRSQTYGEVEDFHFRDSAMAAYRVKHDREWSPTGRHNLQYGVAKDGIVISDKRKIPYPLQYERRS